MIPVGTLCLVVHPTHPENLQIVDYAGAFGKTCTVVGPREEVPLILKPWTPYRYMTDRFGWMAEPLLRPLLPPRQTEEEPRETVTV